MIFKIRGCSLGCPDTIADIGKALSQLQGFFLTIVCDSKDNIAEVWQMKIGSLKSLVESFFQGAVKSYIFINGILNKIAKDMLADGSMEKIK